MVRLDPTRALSFVIVLGAGGCAVLAGYDFGKYQLGEGGGGNPATSTSQSTASVTGTGGAGGETTTSTSSTTGSTSTTTSSTSTTSTSTTSTSTTSSSTTTSTTITTDPAPIELASAVDCPVDVALSDDLVWFCTNLAVGGNQVGLAKIDGSSASFGLMTGIKSAPAIAADPIYAYVAANDAALATNKGRIVKILDAPMVPSLGVTANLIGDITRFNDLLIYTTLVSSGADGTVETLATGGGTPTKLLTNAVPTGPVAADIAGVYFATASNIMRVDFAGAGSNMITMVSDQVNGLAADNKYVYWTSNAGGVRRISNDAQMMGASTMSPGSQASTGIVVNGGFVYFSQGDAVWRYDGTNLKTIATGLVAPRGLAVDSGFVYIADAGSCSPGAKDGKILKVPR